MRCWEEKKRKEREKTAQREREREARSAARQQNTAGKVARGIASAAIVAHAAYTDPQQNGAGTQQHWGQATAQREADRQTREVRDGTRDKGVRDRGTSQQ